MSIKLANAVDTVRKSLQEDADFRFSWQSAIARSFVEFGSKHPQIPVEILFEVAQNAAHDFLTDFCEFPLYKGRPDLSDLDQPNT